MRRTLQLLGRTGYYTIVSTFWVWAGGIFITDNIFVVRHVEGRSMAPTLSPMYHETGRGDFVLWNKWSVPGQLQRGDVLHFMNPSDQKLSLLKE